MADRWFRLPKDGYRPKYSDRDGVTGFSGNTIGNSPQYVVRFYGDTATLDAIEAESDVTALDESNAAQALSNGPNVDSLPNGANASFWIE